MLCLRGGTTRRSREPGTLAHPARWPQAYSRRVLEDAGNDQQFSTGGSGGDTGPGWGPARVPAGAAAAAGVLVAVRTVPATVWAAATAAAPGPRPRRRRLRVRDRRWFGWFGPRRFRRYRLRRSGIVGCFTGGRYGRAGELCWHLDMIPRRLLATRRGGGCARSKRPWRNATPGRVSAEFGASRSASPEPPHPGRPAAQRRRGPVQAAATRPARSCPPTRPLPPRPRGRPRPRCVVPARPRAARSSGLGTPVPTPARRGRAGPRTSVRYRPLPA